MTTQVLLDTNTYLRLAKRIRPAVGRKFGQVPYVLVILKAVEEEVHRSARLRFLGIPVDRDRSFRFVVTGDSGGS